MATEFARTDYAHSEGPVAKTNRGADSEAPMRRVSLDGGGLDGSLGHVADDGQQARQPVCPVRQNSPAWTERSPPSPLQCGAFRIERLSGSCRDDRLRVGGTPDRHE